MHIRIVKPFLLAGLLACTIAAQQNQAFAQTDIPRAQTLRVVQETLPNTLDPAGLGGNPRVNGYSWNTYDRLITFGSMALPNGNVVYDYNKLIPALAESWSQSTDGKTLTFKLRKNATFHDGAPVTAEDVKWSLDRAVSVTMAKNQMASGSLTDPAQFVVLDAHTIRIDLPRADRYTLPNLALSFPVIINAKRVRAHAAADDPWGEAWLKSNDAGGGAYKLAAFEPGQRLELLRHDGWNIGPQPQMRRVILQQVPAAASRRALIERGDADIAMDILPRDIVDMEQSGKFNVVSTPQVNAFQFVAMNTGMKPFDDVRVRQAIAYALPYKAMFQAALLGRGFPLFGGAAETSGRYPAPHPYNTDLEKAKKLLAEAGLANGFETSFSFDAGIASVAEPAALLVQENLARIGIKLRIEKIPAGQIGNALSKKEVPFYFEGSAAWLRDTDYFFRIFYQGDTRWNYGNYHNPEITQLVRDARWETDPAVYRSLTQRMVQIANRDVPVILLWQAAQELVAQKNLQGFVYYHHRQVDFRSLSRK